MYYRYRNNDKAKEIAVMQIKQSYLEKCFSGYSHSELLAEKSRLQASIKRTNHIVHKNSLAVVNKILKDKF